MAFDISDLRNMTKDELEQKLHTLKTELFGLRSQAQEGRVEKPHKVKEARRHIARIMTVLREVEKKDVGK
ncbi:MAG: 50S ribosomal protein L29 [Candidatus Omnitrophota bacterium]